MKIILAFAGFALLGSMTVAEQTGVAVSRLSRRTTRKRSNASAEKLALLRL